MTAAERGVRAAVAALTDAEIRRLRHVEVRESPHPGRPGLRAVTVEMVFDEVEVNPKRRRLASSAELSPEDVNAALAAVGARCARAQRPE